MKKQWYRIYLAIVLAVTCLLTFTNSGVAQGNNEAQEAAYHQSHGPEEPLIADCDKFTAADLGVAYINEKYRAPLGVAPMACNHDLCLLAEARAKEIAYPGGHLSHFTVSGENLLFSMMDAAGDGVADGGENLVYVNEYVSYTLSDLGYAHEQTLSSNVKEAADWYTKSHEGHYENMVHPNNNICGIGFYYDPYYKYLIVVHLFAS